MDLAQINSVTGTVELRCTHCPTPSNKFRIEFRKDFSTRELDKYRQLKGMPLGDPSDLVAVCIGCKNEISITDNSHQKIKVPNSAYWEREWTDEDNKYYCPEPEWSTPSDPWQSQSGAHISRDEAWRELRRLKEEIERSKRGET